uniref:F5/8 type C domain-containing protein n=2 Tax=Clytia hemisphaerica TaxID=252671 RepID=A0A7M6DJ89_9CNID
KIDLGRLCNISAIEIQWWGISVSRKYKIYASPDKSNSESTLVATHHSAIESPPPDEYNEWSKLPGWDREMRKIKFVFKKGHKDPWGMNVLIGIRQIQILGQEKEDPTSLTTNLLERYLLKRVQKTFSKEFSQIAKDFFIDIKKSGSSLISINASITTSSGQDLAYNLLDGTDSEWWTKKKEATIELDLGRSYHVALFEIKWWGISFAASFTVSVAMGDEDNYVEVMTRGNCYEHPAGRDSYNEWSKSNGWEQITRKIKIHLKDGCIDPWFKKYYLGARCIQITGFPA